MKRTLLWTAAAALALALNATAQNPQATDPNKKPAPVPKDNSKLPAIAGANLAKIEAALPATASAMPKSARKILVFWRCEQFFHDRGIAGGNKAIELMGSKTGAFRADFSRDYADLEAANLAKYDALVFKLDGIQYALGDLAADATPKP